MFSIGDKVSVLLPYWVQVHDDVTPYVPAKIVAVSEKTITVEYDAPNTWSGKACLVINELGRISKVVDIIPDLTNSYDAEMLAEWEKTQKILDERYPLSSGG